MGKVLDYKAATISLVCKLIIVVEQLVGGMKKLVSLYLVLVLFRVWVKILTGVIT